MALNESFIDVSKLERRSPIRQSYKDGTKESNNTNETDDIKHGSNRSPIVLLIIFTISMSAMALLIITFPSLRRQDSSLLKIPRNLNETKQLANLLEAYRNEYYFHVIAAYTATFLFLQTFMIPGTIFLVILGGFLFSFSLALILVCMCSAVGATLCYILSQMFGRRLIIYFFPQRVAQWNSHVERHVEHMLNYIIFLRATPILPNWFINIASPIVGVPISPFFFGTFIGVAPPCAMFIHAGQTIHQLTATHDAISTTSIVLLAFFALLALLPVFYKKKLIEKLD